MTGGFEWEPAGLPLPSPDVGTRAPVPPIALAHPTADETPSSTPVFDTDLSAEVSAEPVLPPKAAKAPQPMPSGGEAATDSHVAWYRSDHERQKSVHRRANPMWRRLSRSMVGLSLAAVVGFGLFLGARELQDHIEWDKLPSPGVDDPNIRATSFEIRSTAPAPVLDGTLTIDSRSRALEFAGRGTGAQAGLQIVSPNGSAFFVRTGVENWSRAGSGDATVEQLKRALPYLLRSTTSDNILHSRLRRGFIELLNRADEGEGDAQLRRYEMEFNTLGLAENFPLQWNDYRAQAIPGIAQSRAVPVTMWIDSNDVLVQLTDTQTGWEWERLTYNDQQFTPIDPSSEVAAGERAAADAAEATAAELDAASDSGG